MFYKKTWNKSCTNCIFSHLPLNYTLLNDSLLKHLKAIMKQIIPLFWHISYLWKHIVHIQSMKALTKKPIGKRKCFAVELGLIRKVEDRLPPQSEYYWAYYNVINMYLGIAKVYMFSAIKYARFTLHGTICLRVP